MAESAPKSKQHEPASGWRQSKAWSRRNVSDPVGQMETGDVKLQEMGFAGDLDDFEQGAGRYGYP